MMWFLQIAQLSTTISQAQRATALYFLISKRGFGLSAVEATDPDAGAAAGAALSPATSAVVLDGAAVSMSMPVAVAFSAMVVGAR